MPETIHRYDAGTAGGLKEKIVEAYIEVHAEQQHDPFYQRPRFRRQLEGHMRAPRWEIAVAEDDGEVLGFAYGFALSPTTAWWKGLIGDVPEGFVMETGQRTFALSELNVRRSCQGRGLAGRLYRELLSNRTEERATLLTEPDNAAHAIYAHWGWSKVAKLRPSWEGAPVFDVLILPLHKRGS